MNRTLAKVALFVLVVIGLLIYHVAVNVPTDGWGTYSLGPLGAMRGQGPQNSTLGFQKIFFINLPSRTDRKDMMNLMASYLDLDFQAMDAVNGSSIVEKAMPYNMRDPPQGGVPTPQELGCWRSHANVWSHIITSGISSALIFEDDADFSVGIRDILEGVSIQLQDLLGAKNGEPYGLVDGNSWDILQLGMCYPELPDPATHPKSAGMIRSWVDPYAPERDDLAQKYLPDAGSNRVRVLSPTKAMACTQAYAVSRAGAMRLLYNLGGPGHVLDRPVDVLMSGLIKEGILKSFILLPTVVGQWIYGDWRASDIRNKDHEEPSNPRSWAEIVQSVRQEISDVLGNRNVWTEIESEEE